MAIYEHITEFEGFPVKEFDPALPLENPAGSAYRLCSELPPGTDIRGIGCCLSFPAGIGITVAVWFVTGTFWKALLAFCCSTLLLLWLSHVVNGWVVRYKRGRYCPYCGARLSQRWARQCFSCDTDWRVPPQRDATGDDAALLESLEQTTIGSLLGRLVMTPGAELLPAIIISESNDWGTREESEIDEFVEPLVAVRDKLPNLRALFISEVTAEQCEISWIQHGDVSPVFEAYPELETFYIRGCGDLNFGHLSHHSLKKLVVQSGGLSTSIVDELAESDLPQLEHLELWLGTEVYGGDVTIDNLEELLRDDSFPRLRYLGLRNCEITDEIAAMLVDSPLLERLRVLDLSLGCLSDEGAELLLNCPAVRKLEKLDIHYHYVSERLVNELESLGIELDADDFQEPDDYDAKIGEPYRYCAVSE